MDPLTLSLISAAISLAIQEIPKIREALSRGEILDDQQLELLAKFEHLQKDDGTPFAGDNWTKSDGTPSRSQYNVKPAPTSKPGQRRDPTTGAVLPGPNS